MVSSRFLIKNRGARGSFQVLACVNSGHTKAIGTSPLGFRKYRQTFKDFCASKDKSSCQTHRMQSTAKKMPPDVKESIRAFILAYATSRGITELKDDEPILTTNIIDSLGSFEMILFLEKTFPLKVEDADMDPDNFQTLNHVERFVLGKLGNTENTPKHHASAPLHAQLSRECRHCRPTEPQRIFAESPVHPQHCCKQ